MKQSQVITASNPHDFETRVNALLKDGWRVVPESLRASVSSAYNEQWGGRIETRHLLVALVEKP